MGYHDIGRIEHFFGRIVPNHAEYERWVRLTRIGKLAWFWSTLHTRVLAQFAQLPNGVSTVLRLEDLDYERYVALAVFAGVNPMLSRDRFAKVVGGRPGSLWRRRSIGDWSRLELEEFTAEIGSVAPALGYMDDVERRWHASAKSGSGAAISDTSRNRNFDLSSGGRASTSVRLPFAQRELIATLSDTPAAINEAAEALELGIGCFRIMVTPSTVDHASTVIATLSKSPARPRFVIDVGDPQQHASPLRVLGASAVLADVVRPDDLHDLRTVLPGGLVLPRLSRVVALLRWREFVRCSHVVWLSWPDLVAQADASDIVAWLAEHHEEALRNQTLLTLELDLEDQALDRSLVEWALSRGLVLCLTKRRTFETWRADLKQLAHIQESLSRNRSSAAGLDRNGDSVTR
jgi:hypothetical protein